MKPFFNLRDPEIAERIVAKNALAFAFVNQMPIVPGQTLICPIRVAKTCEELTAEEWMSIHDLKKIVCKSMFQALGAEGFNFAWNEEESAGQTVPHFHLHILPRKNGDQGIYQYEPRSFLYRPGTRAISPKEELLEVVALLRKALSLN